jgi:N6-L-threonylcarbamoyladenine synthase
MRILAIETSCDDTAIAFLEAQSGAFKVLSSVVSSQAIHQNYGGVFPAMAKREHQKNLVPVLIESLQEAGLLVEKKQEISPEQDVQLKEILERETGLYEALRSFFETHEKPDVDVIAVTHGPGLEPCLYVGVNFAKALSLVWDLPVIPVNHIEGHILVNLLENPAIEFPAISLVVSGGHTQLILVKGIGDYKILGETRDDAAGECFDKCAKILGLGYPGGPIVSKIAAETGKSDLKLPRPMLNTKDYDFSFSGLKTAVLYQVREHELTKDYVGQMCVEVQEAIIDVLLKKTLQAAKDHNVKTIMLGGGVSANAALRAAFETQSEIPVIFPDPKLSTDNAVMIAVAGYFNENKKVAWQNVSVQANLRVDEAD